MTFNHPEELVLSLISKIDEYRETGSFAMKNIRHVNSSYWDWFDSEKYFLERKSNLIFVGTQENLARDFEKLKQILGLPMDIELPKDPIKAHRINPNEKKVVNQKGREILNEFYKDDYAFMDFISLIRND